MSTGVFRFSAILASAVLFALYARVELPWAWLGWIALIPWLATLDRERTTGAAVASGAAMSMAFTVGVFSWFAEAVARYTHAPLGVAYGLILVAAPLLQPQFMVFAAVRHRLAVRGASGLIASTAAACVWVGTEWIWPQPLGHTLGHGLLPFATFRQGADLAGAPGLTLVILIVNQQLLAAGTFKRNSGRRALVALTSALALLCALAGYGTLRLHQASTFTSGRTPLTAVLVQASLGDYDEIRDRAGTFAAVREILEAHMSLSRVALDRAAAVRPVELLVWPETVYPTTFGKPKSPAGAELDTEIVRFVEESAVPLLFGTYDRDAGGEYNAAVLITPTMRSSAARNIYRKRRLFPLTETVPSWLESPWLRTHLPWLGTWQPGAGPPLLTLRRTSGDLALAPLICLDAVSPELALDAARAGADLILTLSNDGWFAEGLGARLHLAVSTFRSIETRLPQLRATNSGITAVIDAGGAITAHANVGQSTIVTATIHPGQQRPTLMTRWGAWLGPATCFLAPLLWLLADRVRRRPRAISHPR